MYIHTILCCWVHNDKYSINLPSTAQIFNLIESGCLLTYTLAPVLAFIWITKDPCFPIKSPTRVWGITN